MCTLTIDALPLMGQGGITNYNRPLFEAFFALAPAQWQVELIFRLGFLGSRRALYQNYKKRLNNCNLRIRKSCLPDRLLKKRWEKNLRVQGNDTNSSHNVFLATTDLVPRCQNAKVGWIVYDMTPLILPQFFDSNNGRYAQMMQKSLERTDFIIAISNRTKQDLIEKFNYPDNKIAVIYPGAPRAVDKEPGAGPGFQRPYICYLGALSRNKNVDGILRIFARCVHEHNLDYDLVLTGKDFCGRTFWAQFIDELKIEDRVHLNGWVTEKQRDRILSDATMLWHFSWYEGFGLPVLEAAAQGVPVLHSNRGALSEILKNPAQQIDPANENEAVELAAAALQSDAIRQEWKALGLERSKEFSWDRSARKLMKCIEINAH